MCRSISWNVRSVARGYAPGLYSMFAVGKKHGAQPRATHDHMRSIVAGKHIYISCDSSTSRLYGIASQLSAVIAPFFMLIIETFAAVSSSGAS